MTPELTLLLWSTLLNFVLILIPANEAVIRNGLKVQTGARDDLPEPSLFNKRATRLYKNMIENMMLFVPLVLAANAAGVSNESTVLGAQLFFYARIAHAVIYLTGMPAVRPVAWGVAVFGMGMIAVQLI